MKGPTRLALTDISVAVYVGCSDPGWVVKRDLIAGEILSRSPKCGQVKRDMASRFHARMVNG